MKQKTHLAFRAVIAYCNQMKKKNQGPVTGPEMVEAMKEMWLGGFQTCKQKILEHDFYGNIEIHRNELLEIGEEEFDETKG